MPVNDIIRLLQHLETEPRQKSSGEILVRAGDFPIHIYLIKKGLVIFDEYCAQAKENRPGLGYPRRIWGLKEAYLNKAFHRSVIVKEPILYFAYPCETIFKMSEENPYFRMKLMGLIAKEIGETNLHFE